MVLISLFEFHEDFYGDLKKLSLILKKRVSSKIRDIKMNPRRFKHLSGPGNYYSARVGDLRIIYGIKENKVKFLMVEQRSKVYQNCYKRISRVREALVHYGINNE